MRIFNDLFFLYAYTLVTKIKEVIEMDYKTAYKSLIERAFDEIEYNGSSAIYKLSDQPQLNQNFLSEISKQAKMRIIELKQTYPKIKEEQYKKEVELFKLNYLVDCLHSPEILDLTKYKKPDDPSITFNQKDLNIMNSEAYMDVLDNANSHMHTIRIILRELWMTKEENIII